MVASIASQQILNAFAKSEVANVLCRHRIAADSSATWESVRVASTSADTSSSTTMYFAQLLSTFTEAVSSSFRKAYTSVTSAVGTSLDTVWIKKNELIGVSGAAAACSHNNKNNNNVFTIEQEHVLSGIVSQLHQEHSTALSESNKRTLILCGLTALASCGVAAAATWYALRPPSSSSTSSSSSTPSAEANIHNNNKITKIKNLTFRGNAEGLVSLLERLNENGTPVEIENASVEEQSSSCASHRGDDSFVTEVVYNHPQHNDDDTAHAFF